MSFFRHLNAPTSFILYMPQVLWKRTYFVFYCCNYNPYCMKNHRDIFFFGYISVSSRLWKCYWLQMICENVRENQRRLLRTVSACGVSPKVKRRNIWLNWFPFHMYKECIFSSNNMSSNYAIWKLSQIIGQSESTGG